MSRTGWIAWAGATTLCALLPACSDGAIEARNSRPEAKILSHREGDHVREGYEVVLRGNVSDDNVGERLVARWRVNEQLACEGAPDAEGETSCVVRLGPGAAAIKLEVSDTVPQVGQATVTLSVDATAAPEATILLPDVDVVAWEGRPVELSGLVSDLEDPADTLRATWTSSLDGTLVEAHAPDSTGASRAFVYLSRGVHRLTLAAVDTTGKRGDAAVSLTVGPPNLDPSAPEVTVLPERPGTLDGLVATLVSPAVDPEGAPLTYTWSWTVDGVAFPDATGPTVPAEATSRGQHWAVEVTAHDGHFASPPASASTTIVNTPPTVDVATVSPAEVRVGEPLTCSWQGSYVDPDGDPDRSTARWWVNGQEAGTGPALMGGFGRGDNVWCEVLPSDGLDEGAAVLSNRPAVVNTPPAIDAPRIVPQPAFPGDPLTCSWGGFDDPDAGDTDHSTVAWTVDGAPAGAGAVLTRLLAVGARVGCEVTPSDGFDAGTPRTVEAVIGSAPPSVSGVHIDPGVVYAGTPLTCGWVFVDPNGGGDRSTVVWRIDGVEVGEGVHLLGGFSRGQRVECEVTPRDDQGESGPPASGSVVVSNSPPRLDSATISPRSPSAGDTLTVSAEGWSDPDGDPEAYLYTWFVDGAGPWTGPTLSGDLLRRGDVVTVRVTPFDGFSDGPPAQDEVTVTNSTPEAPVLAITPERPTGHDDLTCGLLVPAPDADGDPLTYTFTWSQASLVYTGGDVGSSDGLSGNVLLEHNTEPGRTFTCTATASDGLATSPPATSTVTVAWPPYTHVDVGDTHGCALDADGGLDCWGTLLALPEYPYPEPIDGVWLDVSAGSNITLAVDAAGHLDGWGQDARAVLDGLPTDGAYVQVSAYSQHACARTADGLVECWGNNNNGQAADRTTPGYRGVAVGFEHTCAIDAAGWVECWGAVSAYGLDQEPPLTFLKVSAGYRHSCGLTTGRQIRCWGLSNEGQGSTGAPPDTQAWIDVAAGEFHSCAVSSAGRLKCWGRESGSCVGGPNRDTGVYTQVAAGKDLTCALRADGELKCWGTNSGGQTSPPPVTPPGG